MELTLDITGTGTLLMHNARLSNPLDPIARAMKKVSAKRAKSEDDHAELAHLEFLGSLYHDAQFGPFLPGDNIWRALYDAAKKRRLGEKVKSGMLVMSDVNPLAYPGPRDAEELWADESFRHQASVKVTTSRVTRTRPQFTKWATQATLYLDTEVLDADDLAQIVEIAGSLVGLGDWRPRYGRFAGSLS